MMALKLGPGRYYLDSVDMENGRFPPRATKFAMKGWSARGIILTPEPQRIRGFIVIPIQLRPKA
jgi:hypothetical protein